MNHVLERPSATAAVVPTNASAQVASKPLPGEFLTIKLGAEEYAIEILRVQEIRSYEQPTRIATAPECVKGIINLRGVIVPVVDLRMKFGMSDVKYDEFTVVVMLNVAGRVLGAVVDSVSDVCQLKAEHIKPNPAFSTSTDAELFTGIGSLNGRMLILLDIEALMRSPELCLLEHAAAH